MANGKPLMHVPLRHDWTFLYLLEVVVVREEDALRHGQVGAVEGAVDEIAATTALQSPVVRRDSGRPWSRC